MPSPTGDQSIDSTGTGGVGGADEASTAAAGTAAVRAATAASAPRAPLRAAFRPRQPRTAPASFARRYRTAHGRRPLHVRCGHGIVPDVVGVLQRVADGPLRTAIRGRGLWGKQTRLMSGDAAEP